MGAIKTSKLANGNIGLEITYGGKDAPFGGIDSSMPPRYIEPNCFVDASGFLISAGQLIATGWKQSGITLAGFPNGATILGGGNFYSNSKYMNWVLACVSAHTAGSPGYTSSTYYIWVWNAGTTGAMPLTAQVVVKQFDQTLTGTPAVAIIQYAGGAAFNPADTDVVAGGITETVHINVHDNAPIVAVNMINAINADAGFPCTAIEGDAPYQIKLTTKGIGSAMNATTLSVDVTDSGCPTPSIVQGFQGGTDGIVQQYAGVLNPLSWVVIGETLYFGGPAAFILQFNIDPINGPQFAVTTQYLGAITLQKYNGQLLAGGIVPGPDLTVTSPEMIIAWSAPEGQYGIWSPLDANGNVTGAGFNEEADISDYLTGILISPGSAAILRTQGIDYITALQNGVSPFDFQHVSNSKKGEGCQDSRLVLQYDRVGIFVGNSDVFVYSGGLEPVGQKIRNLLLQATNTEYNDSEACVLFLTGELNVFAFFMLSNFIFVFNLGTKDWMAFTFARDLDSSFQQMCVFADAATSGNSIVQFYNIFRPVIIQTPVIGGLKTPQFFSFTPTVNSDEANSLNLPSFVIFPQEEIEFGRDVSIDALFVSVSGVPGQVLNWSVSGTYEGNPVTATVEQVLPGTASPNVYTDYKLYFDNMDICTVKNPQLRVDVPLSADGVYNQLSIEKIAMFGSYDPNQKPV